MTPQELSLIHKRLTHLEAMVMATDCKVIPLHVTPEQASRIAFQAGEELGVAKEYVQPTQEEAEQFALWVNTIIKYLPCYQELPNG